MTTAMMVYLCMFAVGFMILLFGFILGGDHEAGADADHDIGGGDHGDDTMGPSVFSLKVIACFLIGFGGGALINNGYSHLGAGGGLGVIADVLCGCLGGFIMAALGYALIRAMWSQQGNSNFSLNDCVGKSGALTLGIPENGTGEMTLEVKGVNRALDVRSDSGQAIKTGTLVKIVRIDGVVGRVAEVADLREDK